MNFNNSYDSRFGDNYQKHNPYYNRHENRDNFWSNDWQNVQQFDGKSDDFYRNSASNKRSFNEMSNDLSQHSFQSSSDNSFQNSDKNSEKSKCETIIIELDEKSKKILTESVLRKELTIYGDVRKVWFNLDKSKAFISFYNKLSVDMILENGSDIIIKSINLTVNPLKVITPEVLDSVNGSSGAKTIVKSDNSSIKGRFPSVDRKHDNYKINNTEKNLLKDWAKTFAINNNFINEYVMKADDVQQQIDILLNNLLLNENDIQKRIKIKDKLQEILNSNDYKCVLHFLGSTVNKLGFRDSDIDLYIEMTESSGSESRKINFEKAMHLLKQIHRLLRSKLNCFIPKPIPSIRCPIIRLDFGLIYQNMRFNGLVCDLSVSNGLGPQNSKLIRFFCDFEIRFQQLAIILRYWAKLNGFIGSTEMSSYAFTHLVIFFCQNTFPPLLPTVELLQELTSESLVINGWECSFCDDINAIKPKFQQNSQTVIELLPKFFEFYANFDFSTQVICTKTGLTRHKTSFESNEETNGDLSHFKLTSLLCIEDPFELSHNLTSNLKIKVFYKFTEYLKHIYLNSSTIFSDKNETKAHNDLNLWGINRIITEFDPTPTGHVFPEHFVGFANTDLVLNKTESELNVNDIIETMANNLSELMAHLLRDVYKIEYILLAKWDIIVNQLSPFAEFYVKFRGIDFKVIASVIRDAIRSELNEDELNLNYFEREKLITEKIDKKFSDSRNESIVPIHCHFVLVMNSSLTFPTFELSFIEIKPSFDLGKGVIDFLKRAISCAAHEQKLLSVNKDLV